MLFTNEQLKSIFVDGGFLTAEEFEKARKTAALRQVPVTDSIVEFGYLSDSEVGALLAAEKGLFFVDLSREKVNQNTLLLIPEKVALAKRVVAYKKDKEKVWVAMANPDDYEFIKLLEKKIGPPLKIVYATPFGIEGVLKGYQKDLLLQATELIERMSKKPQEQDIVKLVDLLIRSAHENRASDIHIEPEEEYVIVRFRIDGVMHEMLRYPITNHDKVVFRIKILGRMRTDEHAQAQDGRFEFKSEEGRFNLRVSIIPITRGENVVMRILSEKFQRLRLEDLGFLEHDLAKIKKVSKLPHGMIIASGPTGSGKTTSLYAVINVLNKPDVNITTIEDPVEYDIKGVRQIQVNPRTNLTFEAGLKSIVRQDPDVIMVGEIRDPQTAGIAVNAALTGHLVMSSMHANDAATTFPRLFEMGVEPFLVASSVNIVVSQRLVRKICNHCIESISIDAEMAKAIESDKDLAAMFKKINKSKGITKARVYKGKGCEVCSDTGYSGRMGIFEILEVTETLRPLIVNKATSNQIRETAIAEGMKTMMEDGLMKVFKGQTTMEEVLRATKA